MKKIIFIMIWLSSFVFADFTKSGDIVTDTQTSLQWQDDADAKNVKKNWQEAINYCENLTLGGHDDWRLPNINELKSIVDSSKYNPAIVDGFTNVSSNLYWSSTAYAGGDSSAWYVGFVNGSVSDDGKSYSTYVRCVRDGQ